MKAILLRFPAAIEPRIEVLLKLLAADAEFRALRMSQSAVLRMALYEGLEALERRYGIAEPG